MPVVVLENPRICRGELFFHCARCRIRPTTKQAKDYVAATLTPTLTAGLVALCRAKPAEPAAFLAQYLIEHNPAGGKAKA